MVLGHSSEAAGAYVPWRLDRLSATLSNSDTLSVYISVIEDHHYKELDYELNIIDSAGIKITGYPIVKKEKKLYPDGTYSREHVKRYTIKIPEKLLPGEYKISFRVSGKVKTREGEVVDIEKEVKILKITVTDRKHSSRDVKNNG